MPIAQNSTTSTIPLSDAIHASSGRDWHSNTVRVQYGKSYFPCVLYTYRQTQLLKCRLIGLFAAESSQRDEVRGRPGHEARGVLEHAQGEALLAPPGIGRGVCVRLS